ncbi:MAG: hypothetical protein KBG48_24230 [Kofleriaceae bacterium]|jgi:hypothetical protein|nr:hypothetical protein [Kofleriaceae bacterium]MBP9170535.1 hypothetical protein [Kofleriaceae bacterium]MBP9860971.1 hypothetical protein [Kofleriaceae bacterium]
MSASRPGFGAAVVGAVADRETRGRWATALTLAVALVAATWWFLGGHDAKGRETARPYADAPYYYVYLPSLVLDRDLDFANQYQVSGNWYRFGPTPRGRPGNVFGVGPALLSTPAFAIGHVAAIAGDERRDGWSDAEQRAVMWMSVLLSVLALWFPARVIARRFATGPIGLFAALAVACGGPVVYYAVRQPGYAHPFATFFAAWLIDAWDASYDRPRTARTWAGLGALLGLATLARPQLATWGLLLVAAALDDLRRGRRDARLLGRWALGAAIALACVVPQLLVWRALYGELYVVPQGSGFMRWDAPAWSEVLFSGRNGLVPWAPIYAVAGLGLFAALPARARLAGLLLVGIGLQAVVNGAAWDWWGGGSFGGRRFDSCFAAFAIGLGALLAPGARALGAAPTVAWRWWRRGATALATAAIATLALALAAANVGLAIHYDHSTARIYGGDSAANVYRIHLRDGWRVAPGQVAAWAARTATAPARAVHAARTGLPPASYDRVVGVHLLGETYPGLNSIAPARDDRRDVGALPAPFRYNLRPVPERPGVVRTVGLPATLVVPVNVRGPLEVAVVARHPLGGAIALSWNGRAMVRAVAAPTDGRIAFTTADVRRGPNQLAIVATPGTELAKLELRVVTPPSR